MRKIFFLIFFSGFYLLSPAQKVIAIYFNLYTDSLKKGFYNYINVDGRLSDGTWMPLTGEEIIFTSNAGKQSGNDLFIDSCYSGDSVVVKAILKSDPSIWKQVTIYIRKRGFTEPLKTEQEVFDELRRDRKKTKHGTV